MTNGGAAGPGGGPEIPDSAWTPRRVMIAGFAVWLALVLIQCSVNAMSQVAENPDAPAWTFWSWELTSAVGWVCVAFPLWRLVARLPGLARRPLMVAGLLLAASLALSLLHIAVMFGLRFGIYALLDAQYEVGGDWPGIFVYEYRKDVSTLLQMGLSLFAIQWLMRRAACRPPMSTPQPRSETIVEIQDGATIHIIPLAEIDRVEAAGNYVEIIWRGRRLLHRTTLAALEEAWASHGFIRIHRGRLVRHAAIRRIEGDRSGDFSVDLADGTVIRGSRRYRANLAEFKTADAVL